MAKAPKTTTAPTGQIAPFGLRMLPELREKIEAAARESGRSMNAEIVARLDASLKDQAEREPGSDPDIVEMQLKITQTGLRLAEMASQFLKLEVPAVEGTDSYRMLQDTLSAGLHMAPDGPNDALPEPIVRAADALKTLGTVAETIGLLEIAEATQQAKTDAMKKSGFVKPSAKK